MLQSNTTLWQGDCLELMKDIPDGSVDLILTDPPYGIGACKGVGGFGVSNTDNHYSQKWDNLRPDKVFFDEMLRVSKSAIIFGGNYFADLLPQSTHWIVWDKKGHYNFKNPYSDCELLWTNINKKTVKKITFIQQGFIHDTKDIRVHPTQKPTELIQTLLELYSKDSDTVLDCYMGSGSVGVACKKLKRNFVGIEIDKDIFNIAKNRIEYS